MLLYNSEPPKVMSNLSSKTTKIAMPSTRQNTELTHVGSSPRRSMMDGMHKLNEAGDNLWARLGIPWYSPIVPSDSLIRSAPTAQSLGAGGKTSYLRPLP